jgi:hypothetical protein
MSESLNESCRKRTEEARRDPRSTHELISLALSETDEGRAWDHVVTLHYRATREVLTAAVALCDSECPVERRLGADVLGQLGVPDRAFPEECNAALCRLLRREADPDVLESACIACGHTQHPAAVPLLARLKSHPRVEVRSAVVHGLLAREDPQAVACLIVLSEDPDEDVRDWATFGLGTQIDMDTPAIRDALARRLDDPDPITRGEAFVGLARRKDERVVPALLEALHPDVLDSFDPRQDLVMEAAEEMADPRLLPGLLLLRGHWDAEWLEDVIRSCSGEDP